MASENCGKTDRHKAVQARLRDEGLKAISSDALD